MQRGQSYRARPFWWRRRCGRLRYGLTNRIRLLPNWGLPARNMRRWFTARRHGWSWCDLICGGRHDHDRPAPLFANRHRTAGGSVAAGEAEGRPSGRTRAAVRGGATSFAGAATGIAAGQSDRADLQPRGPALREGDGFSGNWGIVPARAQEDFADVGAPRALRNSQSDAFPSALFAAARETELADGNSSGPGLRAAAAGLRGVADAAGLARTVRRGSGGGRDGVCSGTRLRRVGEVTGVPESSGTRFVPGRFGARRSDDLSL